MRGIIRLDPEIDIPVLVSTIGIDNLYQLFGERAGRPERTGIIILIETRLRPEANARSRLIVIHVICNVCDCQM